MTSRVAPGAFRRAFGHNICGVAQQMAYLEPTAAALRLLIQKYWRADRDPFRRARADNREYVDLKVHVTQQLMQQLIRHGLRPVDAESQAIREIALAD